MVARADQAVAVAALALQSGLEAAEHPGRAIMVATARQVPPTMLAAVAVAQAQSESLEMALMAREETAGPEPLQA